MEVQIPAHLIADCAAVAKEWGIIDIAGLESRMGEILREAVDRRAKFVQEVLDRTPRGVLALEIITSTIWHDLQRRKVLDRFSDREM